MVVELEYRIEQDTEPESPREWDNLGTMHCWHGHYNLGDEQHSQDSDVFLAELGGFEEDYDWTEEQYNHHKEVAEKRAYSENIILSLYLYDHGGITMNTGGFSCQWDSGQVGWIIVSKAKVREEYRWKNLTKKRIQQIEKYLTGEVETYDQYLTGDIWGYVIENEEHNIHESCWGFYGEEDCEKEAQAMLDCEQKALNEKLRVVPRDLSRPEFNWNTAGDKCLDQYLMELWPNECRELDAIFERGKENKDDPNTGIIPDDEIDRFYELNDFLKESMKGSISRYFSPRRTV